MNAPASGSGWLVTVSLQVDRRGDPVELARVRGGMVRAAGGLRDRLEGGRVERGEQVVAVDVDGGARGGADPDGVDVHAGLLGHRGGRVGAGVGAGRGPGFVLPVGEQHDRGRRPVADVRRAAVAAEGDRLVRDRGQRGEDGRRRARCRRRPSAGGPPPRRSRDRPSAGRPRGRPARTRRRRCPRCPAGPLMNDSAACFAAASRLGATSVAAMLPETSMARMTVPEARDTGTDAAGPATAIASTATPAMVNHTPGRPGAARRPATAATPAAARAAARRRATATAAQRQGRGDEQADGEQSGVGEAHARLRWVLATTSMSAVARSASVPMRWMGTPARRIPAARRASRSLDARAEPGAQQRVAGVDDELLPGLGVLDDDQAGVGQFVVGGVDDAQGDDLVARHQAQQRPLPVAVADEVGDDHDQGAAPGELGDRVEHRREVGRAAAGAGRRRSWRARRRCAARACGPVPGGTVRTAPGVVEQRADAVPAPAEQPGEHQGKLAEHVVLAAPGRAHRHGRRTVEHQPHGELAVLGEHAKLRLVQPGGDVPVDVPRVVALGVFAQADEVGSGPPVRGAVAARQASVEAADDPPFQAEQEPFRGGAHGHEVSGRSGRPRARPRRRAPS